MFFFAVNPQHLRQELEAKFYDDSFDWEQVRQNDAAGLLKMFIRELPYPLLTLQHLPAFTAAQSENLKNTLSVPCAFSAKPHTKNKSAFHSQFS